jgi:hypothetical protein
MHVKGIDSCRAIEHSVMPRTPISDFGDSTMKGLKSMFKWKALPNHAAVSMEPSKRSFSWKDTKTVMPVVI